LPLTGLTGTLCRLARSHSECRERSASTAGLHVPANNREAPACMRCRGLTGSRRATDLPIPQLIRAPPDRHLANSPHAIPGPPVSRRLSGLPPRWPAVQVVNEFLLPARPGSQGLSIISSRFFCCPQHDDCYPPRSPLIHRIPTVFAQPLRRRPACAPARPAGRGFSAPADVVLAWRRPLAGAACCRPLRSPSRGPAGLRSRNLLLAAACDCKAQHPVRRSSLRDLPARRSPRSAPSRVHLQE